MSEMKRLLQNKIERSQYNFYRIDNYDEHRFGKYVTPNYYPADNFIFLFKRLLKQIIKYNNNSYSPYYTESYFKLLDRVYKHLNKSGKKLLVELMAFKQLGWQKVKLRRNNKEYSRAMKLSESLANQKDTYDPHFLHFLLQKFNLESIGYDIKLYFSIAGIAIDFIIEQYAYKLNKKTIVGVEKGDVIIDAGACWGDTALYFAHKTSVTGKVYSFEFIPGNIRLFEINRSLNKHLEKIIELVPHPVSNRTGEQIYFKDNGPGSRVEFQPFEGRTGIATTLTIDDFVKRNHIEKIDFIKMDIEGAEFAALQGAIETIKRFKPKLAVAIYHSMEDFVNIPNWILDLGLGYEIFLDHYTIHAEETICFAKHRSIQ